MPNLPHSQKNHLKNNRPEKRSLRKNSKWYKILVNLLKNRIAQKDNQPYQPIIINLHPALLKTGYKSPRTEHPHRILRRSNDLRQIFSIRYPKTNLHPHTDIVLQSHTQQKPGK
jgi:hypothetical protein